MSNVPMTRPEEALAIHDMQCGHASTFVGLAGGRILLHAGVCRVSDDGGLTWGEPYQGVDENNETVAGSCLVPLPEGYGRWSYPSVYVAEDRVLIAHTYSVHDSRTSENMTPPSSSKLKVLPISWFYGGDDPTRESTTVRKISSLPPRP